MATQRLNIDIVAKDKSKQALGKLQGSLSKVKASVFNLKNAFIGLGAGLVLRGIVNAGLQIENLGVQLEALFGSAEKGKAALETVTKFAKTTPFELSNIQQGITALATVTEKAESLGISFEELLKITGNTATLLDGDFALAAMQIQRTFSAGIGAADLFRDKGIKAMAGFSAGVATSIDESIIKMSKAFGTGGKFGELTAKLAETLSGTVSNLKDAFFTIQTEIAAGFFDELKRQLGDLRQFTEDNDQAIRRLSREMGENLAVAILKLSNALKSLITNFRDFQSVIGLASIAVGGFAGKLIGIGLIVDDVNRRFDKLGGVTKEIKVNLDALYDDMPEAIKEVQKEAEVLDTFLYNVEHELSYAIPNATQKAIDKFRELNDTSLENIKNKMADIKMTIAEGLHAGIARFSDSLARAIILGEDLGKSFKKMVQDSLVSMLAFFIDMIIQMGIQKLLGDKLLLGQNKRLNSAKNYTRELQKQVAFAAILAILTGGGSMAGGGGSSFTGFAKGGAVSKGEPIVVGENGAELFIPNSSGQITQSARGTGGNSATTVNFNITTVDAKGFDQLLVERRGTISRIINESVNEKGRGAVI